ncbi:MAG TPA: hypothetical protein VFM93_08250 [Candidatus Limnocylindria bacterium]|nr:hypothetical protein [Candidatus Limnocylindria bacterium]
MGDVAIRAAGLATIAAAVLFGMAMIPVALDPSMGRRLPSTASLPLLGSAVLLVVSLPAIYARQAEASGWIGLGGYVFLQAGALLLVVAAASALLHPTSALGEHPLLFGLGVALVVGLLLTAIATLSAGVLPQGAGVLLLGAMVGFFFVFFVAEFLPAIAGHVGNAVFGLVLALALAWIGVSLWRGSP